MAQKPSCEELKQRVRELEREARERKRLKELWCESEKKYRSLFELAADSIVLVDGETGALVEFNKSAHKSLGYTRKEFEKLTVPDFEVTEDADAVARHMKKVLKEGGHTFQT